MQYYIIFMLTHFPCKCFLKICYSHQTITECRLLLTVIYLYCNSTERLLQQPVESWGKNKLTLTAVWTVLPVLLKIFSHMKINNCTKSK